jgi:hypothetical protein
MPEKRNVTKTDETTGNGATVRRWYEDDQLLRIDVFNPSGFKIGSYKTEAAALRAAERS